MTSNNVGSTHTCNQRLTESLTRCVHPPVCPGSASGHPLYIQQWRPNGAIAATSARGGRGGPRNEGETLALLSFLALASAVCSGWSFRLEHHVLGMLTSWTYRWWGISAASTESRTKVNSIARQMI